MKRDWLIDARRHRNLTQREMGRKLNISKAYYSMIECGVRKKNLDLATTRKLAVILGLGIEKLILAEEKYKADELFGPGE